MNGPPICQPAHRCRDYEFHGFSRIYQIQLRRSKDMIAISILCGLLICLFWLDSDEAAKQD
jgi:hypothetical protein